MKKITKRRFIALLRKYKIIKYWKNKPYLCATVAVLSLIMLVMLFKKPDTVSAIADLCMAAAAIFAAYHAKDWLSPSLRNKGFDLAVDLISSIYPKLIDNLKENYTYNDHITEYFQEIESKINHAERYETGFFSFTLQLKNKELSYFINDNYKLKLKELESKIKKMKETIDTLKILGWILKDKKNFDILNKKLEYYIYTIKKQIYAINEFNDFIEKIKKANNKTIDCFKTEYNHFKKNINDSISETKNQKEKTIKKTDVFFSCTSVQDLFDIK